MRGGAGVRGDRCPLAGGDEAGRLGDELREWLPQPPCEGDRSISLEVAVEIDLTEAPECPFYASAASLANEEQTVFGRLGPSPMQRSIALVCCRQLLGDSQWNKSAETA